MKWKINIEGMHCNKCKERIENYLTKKYEDIDLKIDIEEQTVEVITNNDIKKIEEDLETLGFTVISTENE